MLVDDDGVPSVVGVVGVLGALEFPARRSKHFVWREEKQPWLIVVRETL